MLRSRKYIQNDTASESTFELDLAPMLALMVTLIPIMLLATSFVKMRVIETVLPQAVKEAIENDKKTLQKVVSIDMQIKNNEFFITVKEDGKIKIEKLIPPGTENTHNYSDLHSALIEVKKSYPEKFVINIFPDKSVPYSEVIKALDQARESRDRSIKFSFKDKKTNKDVETSLMFPEVNFSGVIGG